jgi:hypothetical protein
MSDVESFDADTAINTAEEPFPDVNEDPFGSMDDMDVDFEFDSAITKIPDGPTLLQVQGVYFSKEYKPERGITTVGTLVQLKVAAEGPYKGNFITKFIWWGNDTPAPQGVRAWVAFAEAALGEKQEGMIGPKNYGPVWRDSPKGRRIALKDFDDELVVGILQTKQKDGEDKQEIVGWRQASTWTEESKNEFGGPEPF